ncbi:hypothetical protein [Ruminococcus flavefaciens]|uniref:Uncharacterized protein n=1 Tax=Ruminococcus flavefaciens 007c TaxID=1341157 RepID=W7V0B5_RUMFL|nr:hypothetical protein [Ruminococcus flavefaciens]EWM54167.1 hypothetical protein RF007C_02505 [Ruminococcus flavefaciens 007c]
MKHPFYSVSIDDIPFGDRIIAILLRTYLVRCKDAEQKLAAVLSEGIVLKLPALAKDQDAIPLKTVLEGEHLAKLIDEAVAFVKADQTDHSDSDIGDIFASAKEMLDNISGKSVVMNMSAELAEYITKLYYALKAGE